jgi:hypothetical protein
LRTDHSILSRGGPALAFIILASLSIASVSKPAPVKRSASPAPETTAGWRQLFDGRSLAGWAATGNRNGWTVEDGTIACLARGGGYLYSQAQFQDFVLQGEFKTAPRCNSGIFVRWSDPQDPVNTGIEIQILDSFGRVKPNRHDCAAIYDIMAPSQDVVRPAGEWNQVEITCDGPILRVVMNGQQVVEADLREWTTAHQNPDGSRNKFRYAYNTMTHLGHIGLQDHGGRCWFRHLQLKPLQPWSTPVYG